MNSILYPDFEGAAGSQMKKAHRCTPTPHSEFRPHSKFLGFGVFFIIMYTISYVSCVFDEKRGVVLMLPPYTKKSKKKTDIPLF